MLTITIPAVEMFDDEKQEFINTKSYILQLEHSLVSLSKWESKWKVPFLGKEEKTNEQTVDYVRCMTITQNIPEDVYYNISQDIFSTITSYIHDSMTATWFGEETGKKKQNKDVITAELIYYWMIAQNIPIEFQKWHLNRLLTLIRVCSIKNEPPKKKGRPSGKDLADRRALMKARREQRNSEG